MSDNEDESSIEMLRKKIEIMTTGSLKASIDALNDVNVPEMLERQRKMGQKVLDNITEFRRRKKHDLGGIKDKLSEKYGFDVRPLDTDIKTFLTKQVRTGILQPKPKSKGRRKKRKISPKKRSRGGKSRSSTRKKSRSPRRKSAGRKTRNKSRKSRSKSRKSRSKSRKSRSKSRKSGSKSRKSGSKSRRKN